MARTRNHSPDEPAKGSRLWRPRARKTRSAPSAGERFGGGRERRDVVPVVARRRGVHGGAEQAAVGDARAGRGLGRVERHDGGERVRGVDERVDTLVGQVAREPDGAAEAAPPHPRRAAPRARRVTPASELVDVVALGRQPAGQLGGLGRAREDQHPSHGCQGRRASPGPGAFQAWTGRVVRSAPGHREHRCESGAVQQLSPGSNPSRHVVTASSGLEGRG